MVRLRTYITVAVPIIPVQHITQTLTAVAPAITSQPYSLEEDKMDGVVDGVTVGMDKGAVVPIVTVPVSIGVVPVSILTNEVLMATQLKINEKNNKDICTWWNILRN